MHIRFSTQGNGGDSHLTQVTEEAAPRRRVYFQDCSVTLPQRQGEGVTGSQLGEGETKQGSPRITPGSGHTDQEVGDWA